MNDIIKVEKQKFRHEQDRAEQYSRRESLLFHGIQETPKENNDALVLATMKEKLGLELNGNAISVSHRLGAKPQPGSRKVRPIIVKFVRRNDKYNVYMSKRKLSGSRIMITESLTTTRMDQYKAAKEQFGVKKVWTSDGRILYHNDEDNKNYVYYD